MITDSEFSPAAANHSAAHVIVASLEALELGTAARHDDGEIALTLPPDMCWAYRDEGAASVD